MRLMVPLDGSLLAATVLPRASNIALTIGAGIQRAVESSRTALGHHLELREAEEYVASVAHQLRVDRIAEVSTSVWEGPAAYAIINAAEQERTDAIVMSTHGRGGFTRLIFGSVADRVVRSTKIPILFLRPYDAHAHPSPSGVVARLVSRSFA